eukprot:3096737-Pyramimonas_sp.AAC.2
MPTAHRARSVVRRRRTHQSTDHRFQEFASKAFCSGSVVNYQLSAARGGCCFAISVPRDASEDLRRADRPLGTLEKFEAERVFP